MAGIEPAPPALAGALPLRSNSRLRHRRKKTPALKCRGTNDPGKGAFPLNHVSTLPPTAGIEPASPALKAKYPKSSPPANQTDSKFLPGNKRPKFFRCSATELRHSSAGRNRTCDPRLNDVTLIYATGKTFHHSYRRGTSDPGQGPFRDSFVYQAK